MILESKRRSVLKAVSWRFWATLTTGLLVWLFTGRLVLALSVGLVELLAKMGLYFLHERLWVRIRYGRVEAPAFVLWFTGLPCSGKKAVADRVHAGLVKLGLKAERLDSRDVRPLFPETGFSPEEVNGHVKRVGHLCAMLEKQGVSVVASFVSPYRESREFARSLASRFVEVHMRSTPEACEARDQRGHYARARRGEYQHFPGVHVPHEPPAAPEVTIDVDRTNADEAVAVILRHIRRTCLHGRI